MAYVVLITQSNKPLWQQHTTAYNRLSAVSLFLSLITLLVIFIPLPIQTHATTLNATGTTYYVALTGDDDNPGTQAQPFATLNYAIDDVLEPGDTLIVHGGTYLLDEVLNIRQQARADARVTIKAADGEAVVLDCAETTYDTSCVNLRGKYLDVIGFEVRNAQRTGINVWGGSHVRIINNVVHHSVRGGIYVGYYKRNVIDDVYIEGNTMYRNCQVNNPPPPTNGSGWPAGITISYATHVTVLRNTLYENYGEGITMYLTDSADAGYNTIYNNYSVNMYIDNTTNAVYHHNFVYNTGNTEFYRYNYPATNIQIANEEYEFTNLSKNNYILNNIAIAGKYGFSYGDYGRGGGLRNVVVANNTFYKAYIALVNIDDDWGHRNSQFMNNIFYQTDGTAMLFFSGSDAIAFHHNAWFGGVPGEGHGAGDVQADPLFVSPGGFTPEHYKLSANSPMRDVGAQQQLVTDDFFGTTRPYGDAYDMGAYEATTDSSVPQTKLYTHFFPILLKNSMP